MPHAQISVQHLGLPTLHDMMNPPDDMTFADARRYLQWHTAIRELLQVHADVACMDVDTLAQYLGDNGYKGKRDNCGECPLANLYVSTLRQSLHGRTQAGFSSTSCR